MTINAVIFDMDGLIFDTENLTMLAMTDILEKKGYVMTREIFVKLLGITLAEGRKILTEEFGEEYPFDEVSQGSREQITQIAHSTGLPIKTGIKELLMFLKEKGIKTAVASSTATHIVEDYLKCSGIDKFFDAVIGGDKVERSKPNPDIFLKACEMLKVEPKNSFVIEDSEAGVMAAVNGGMKPICIPDLKQPCDEIRNHVFAVAKDGFEAKKIIENEILRIKL